MQRAPLRRRARVLTALALICAAALTGCTKHGPPTTVTTQNVTQTRVVTETDAPQTYTPPPPASVAPLPPHQNPPAGEVEQPCPYIKPGVSIDGYGETAPNVAAIEGDHVYRMTVLTGFTPVGCRFYFYAPPYEAIADIQPFTFPSANDAHNAMVLTATKAGTDAIGQPDFAPGVQGILFRTQFFGEDNGQDWACVFAKGKIMVVVHTQRNDQSLSALLLAQAIVGKF